MSARQTEGNANTLYGLSEGDGTKEKQREIKG